MIRKFFILSLLLCSLSMAAQNVTIHSKNRPAEKVFEELMHQSGKNFVYKAGLLNGLRITIDAKNRPLTETLDRIFSGTDITYKVRGNNIMLMNRPKPVRKNITISGFVREDGSEEALTGVTVAVSGTSTGTATNAMGFYSLTIPEGKIELRLIYPGYETITTPTLDLTSNRTLDFKMHPDGRTLEEVTVYGSLNKSLSMESPSIGALNISKEAIKTTPVIMGESDVIKTIQLEPGVSAGVEGMAGMYVHGGNTDENLYMLDNIPLYQVNHLAGLFSAFNTEALRNVDFYKSSFPAKYNGRLSSFMDVHTKDGSLKEHHGSFRLGLTSGAFNIDGPIWKDKTSYSVAIRRSWFDILTIPAFAIYNSISKDEKNQIGYAFTDINAKITHRFSDRSRAYAMFYYGEDYLHVKQSYDKDKENGSYDESKNNLRWGNIVASLGWNYVISPQLFMEVTGAFTRFASYLKHSDEYGEKSEGNLIDYQFDEVRSDNNIHDWTAKVDFDWRPRSNHNFNFGAGYTYHSFLPSKTVRNTIDNDISAGLSEPILKYKANEMNVYGSGDWTPWQPLRINYGLHFSLFNISGHTSTNLSPRLSARWAINNKWTVKAGYSHTVQYVHQLIQSSLSLPTDQWVPIVKDQKPQTADKISVGVYFSPTNQWTFSAEAYYKKMRNLLEYVDEYYLLPPSTEWPDKLTPGKGTSKGIDFKASREFGNITGHVAYSLLWADRIYPGRNGGKKFPARFDNRHKINILVDWKINDKWEISASWTGMSGNRITLPTQVWRDPNLAPWNYDMLLKTDINNYRLPFYHRLDLNARRYTKRGYWDISIYNAYCHMNVIGVDREYQVGDATTDVYTDFSLIPIFRKIRVIPIIPSFSYTWLF